LEQVLKIDPLAKTAYLGSNKSVEEISQSRMRGVDFNISMFRKDPLLVKKAKERGLTVNVWTVNSEEDLRAMIDLRVDYITTNEPELLFKILAK
ncbi:MAG: glycerophosphodiester phosphodiesterase family protein, partial [Bacteroidales bacterium]